MRTREGAPTLDRMKKRRVRVELLTVAALAAGLLGLLGVLVSGDSIDVAMFFALFLAGATMAVVDASLRRLRLRLTRVEGELRRQRERGP